MSTSNTRRKVQEMLMKNYGMDDASMVVEAARYGDVAFFRGIVTCLKQHLTNEQVCESATKMLNMSVHSTCGRAHGWPFARLAPNMVEQSVDKPFATCQLKYYKGHMMGKL